MQTPLEGIPLGTKLNRPVQIPIPIPPSRRMADLNLNKKTPALSLNLSTTTSSSSSNEQKTRGSLGSGFEAMSSNGDSIMGVA